MSVIKEVQDKLGSTVAVKFCDTVAQAPSELMSLFYKTMAELVDKGYGSPGITIHNKCKAVYVEINGKIVGHIIFDLRHDLLRSWIVLSAVDPEYRRRGLYKILHAEYEAVSAKLGMVEIGSFIHINNAARLKSAESMGYFPSHYLMRKNIKN